MKRLFSNQLIRFLFVGGLNTVFGYSVYALFLFVGLHFAVATLLSTVIGVIFNFFTTGRLVFQNRNMRLILRFAGVYGIVYLVQVSMLQLLDSFGLNLYVAGAVLVLPLALLSFVLNKKFVFEVES